MQSSKDLRLCILHWGYQVPMWEEFEFMVEQVVVVGLVVVRVMEGMLESRSRLGLQGHLR